MHPFDLQHAGARDGHRPFVGEDGKPSDKGEVFIDGISVGLSTRLLNRDHEAVYYRGTPPGRTGMPLRRHGDELEAIGGGYYRMAGRCDDTMNLGGIKVGFARSSGS